MSSKIKIVRKSKTVVNKLPSFKTEPASSARSGYDGESVVNKSEVPETEASVGDMFQDVFGEKGKEVDPNTASSRGKAHVRADDEIDEVKKDESTAKPKYRGRVVKEGVRPSKTSEANDAPELDDLISELMDVPAEDVSTATQRPTSTPTKEEVNDADFGDGLSLIRGDDEPPENNPADEDNKRDNKPVTSGFRPSVGPDSSTITTTIKTSYSSKYVPNIPAKFYKDIQARLEDLIFKFECLDNEYAALQKISHNIFLETSTIKEKLST